MTRWLWVWFFLLLSFPVMQPSRFSHLGGGKVRAASAAAVAALPATAARDWGGPLSPVLDGLEWVAGRGVSRDDLAGRVVLVEFWALECVNCRRTLPAMRSLAARYRASDVRVIGIHTPEFPRERDPARVARAVASDSIEYPVALDPEARVWASFDNRYWPCVYLLDRGGRVRYRHIGELHEGSAEWNELTRRIELVRASSSRTGPAPG